MFTELLLVALLAGVEAGAPCDPAAAFDMRVASADRRQWRVEVRSDPGARWHAVLVSTIEPRLPTISSDGSKLAYVEGSGVVVQHLASGHRTRSAADVADATSLCFVEDGARVAVGAAARPALLLDATEPAVEAPRSCTSRRIAVVDKPRPNGRTFRYVRWCGEDYSSASFVGTAKRKRLRGLTLAGMPSDAATRCAAWLARTLDIPVVLESPEGPREIAPANADAPDACEIRQEWIRPQLPRGHVYFSSDGKLVRIGDGKPVPAKRALETLAALGTEAIVISEASFSTLVCAEAIARASGVRLMQSSIDGELSELEIRRRASIRAACRKQRYEFGR